MTEQGMDPWSRVSPPLGEIVPRRYRGVWQRSLLQTSEQQDDTTFVRWLQLGHWHADLRIPVAARSGMAVKPSLPYSPQQQALLALQQGFAGVTRIDTDNQGEVCTWHRLVDYQPPGPSPDAGRMVFETPDRLIETGVHGVYRETWQRLPDSVGPCIALAEPKRMDGRPGQRLFLAGRYLMRVHPCQHVWQPDFEISFGVLEAGQWRIEQSTRPELEGCRLGCSLQRVDEAHAQLELDGAGPSHWHILEWED
jgi:hypothetical protein